MVLVYLIPRGLALRAAAARTEERCLRSERGALVLIPISVGTDVHLPQTWDHLFQILFKSLPYLSVVIKRNFLNQEITEPLAVQNRRRCYKRKINVSEFSHVGSVFAQSFRKPLTEGGIFD